MNIKAIKNTTTLIKGHVYELRSMWNANGNGKLMLKDVPGTYMVNHFTDLSDKPLPSVNINGSEAEVPVRFETLKVGDLLVCKSNSHKSLVYGKMYRIEDLKSIKSKYSIYHNNQKIKLEGVKRYLNYSSWYWRVLSKDEMREVHLLDVLDNKPPEVVTETIDNKFEAMDETEKELFKAICTSVVDGKRHHLSVIDWYCRSTYGKRMNAKPENFEGILDMSLRDLLKLFDQ